MTVTTVLVTVISRVRASSAVPWKAIRSSSEPGAARTCDMANPTIRASRAARLGSTQSAPLAYSRTASQARARRARRADRRGWATDEPDMVDVTLGHWRLRARPDGQPPPKRRSNWAWNVSMDRVPKSRIAQISMASRTPRTRIGAGSVRRLIRISRPE